MNTTAAEVPAVDRAVTVALPLGEAWDLFTRRLAQWWPLASHSCSRNTGAQVIFEPRPGGTVTEIAPDGGRHPWGTLTEWNPPRSFAMWWHPGQPREQATRLRVTFTALHEGTEVRVNHDGWNARGADAAAMREQYDRGWPMVLNALASAVKA
ncbi:MAG: SRPBCC domain-containing protein [Rubrivivax sp.]|nr:SRPBCC domain-containing protein [Rubrivivax sp.]